MITRVHAQESKDIENMCIFLSIYYSNLNKREKMFILRATRSNNHLIMHVYINNKWRKIVLNIMYLRSNTTLECVNLSPPALSLFLSLCGRSEQIVFSFSSTSTFLLSTISFSSSSRCLENWTSLRPSQVLLIPWILFSHHIHGWKRTSSFSLLILWCAYIFVYPALSIQT